MNAEITIDSLSKKGHGVGKLGSEKPEKVEVPQTIPGERVVITYSRRRRRIRSARVEEISHPSPDRIEPRCPHFSVCGGCRLQHWQVDRQVAHKQEKIDLLFSAFDVEETRTHPILPSESPWEYRNKMEWTFSQDLRGQRFLGLIMEGSQGRVFDLQQCHLVHPWFVEGVAAVREWWEASGLPAYFPAKDTGALRTCTMRYGERTGDRLVMITTSGNPAYRWTKEQKESLVQHLTERLTPPETGATLSIVLQIQQAIKGQATQFFQIVLHGPGVVREQLKTSSGDSLTFSISPAAFFQPNTKQAEVIYRRALEMAAFSPGAVIYDLYCGTGTFALCAAKYASSVLGIELFPDAVVDARENGKRNGLDNVTFWQGDVGEKLTEILENGTFPRPEGVIIDPPRSGLDIKGMEQLLRLSPQKIVYVSCNPETQKTNVEELIQHGYRIKSRQAIDAFPHTPHCEHIACLVKS